MKKSITFFLIPLCIIICDCKKNQSTEPEDKGIVITNDFNIMVNGRIVSETGFGMGVDDSRHLCNWIQQDSVCMGLHYPGSLSWGAVFITVGGDPKDPPRPSIDISACTKLSIEMKGTIGGESVQIGIKDKDDPDSGLETKKTVYITKDWAAYVFNLSEFTTCDLKNVYVVTEFVFPGDISNEAAWIDIRDIRILK